MTQNLPPWMNDSFFSSVLEVEGKVGKVNITNFLVSAAVSDNDHFAGSLCRVNVEYITDGRHHTISLIIKFPIIDGAIARVLSENDILAVEPKVYNLVLPLMNKQVNYEFAPRSFNCYVENVLVLQDLKKDGYVMCDKFKQFDFLHCKCVVTNIARFHAASVACHRDDPNLIETIGQERYFGGKSYPVGLRPWLKNSVKVTGEMLGEIEGCERIAKYFFSRCEYIGESVLRICKPKEKGLNVLNHGDMWINNLLIQHKKSGDVSDVKFVDFQYPRYGSPVIDLLYLVWSSAADEVREHKQEELYEHYLRVLNTTLDQLKMSERMAMAELREDMKWASDWVVYIISGELPLMLSDEDNANDLGTVDLSDMGNYEALKKEHNCDHYRKLLPTVAKQFMNGFSL